MANQYLPTDFVSKQVPFGMLNFSLDGKLMYFDKVNFVQRAFISRQEILLWFPLGSLARKGRFEICMNTGGTLGSNGIITGGVDSIWWFSAGEADVNLIQKYYTTLQVDNLIAGATIPDATDTVKGKLKLAGDLAGTADLPTVPGLLEKANIDGQVFTGNISAPNLSGTNTGDQDLSIFELLTNKSTSLSSPNDTTYPTTKAVTDAIVANTNTFTNGLTKGVDNKVKLGGTLEVGITTITIPDNSQLYFTGSGGRFEMAKGLSNFLVRDANFGDSGIFFSSGIKEMKVLDQIGEKGFVYSIDYSVKGLLDERWLADVGGVKKLISQIPVGNGLLKYGVNNRIGLGGTITQSTILDLQDDLTINARSGAFRAYGANRDTALTSYGAMLVYEYGGTFGGIEAKSSVSDPDQLVGLVVVHSGTNPLEMILYDESQSFGAKYNGNFYTKGRLNDRWIPDLGGVKSYVTSLGYELLTNKVGNLSAPNANTYLNTLGLSSALSGKVNNTVPITNGYGVTVGGDLMSSVSIALNTSIVDNRYLRKDVDDNNGVHKLLLGSLESGDTLLTGNLTIPSLGVGTSDDILVVGPSGLIQKKTLVIAGNFGVSNGAGANMFNVDLGTDLSFEGLNDTTVTFDPVTKKISISSIPGSGSGGAVVSFNSRTGAVVPVSGDYNTNMVPESGGVLYFTNARAIASALTGFSSSATTTIVAADSIVGAFGKAQGQINNRVPVSREITIGGTAGRLIIGGGDTQNLSGNPNWTIDLATIGTAGSYMKVTTDAYGRVVSGSNPTTLGAFGITDAYTKTEADGKYYLQTNPAGYITSASLPDLSPYALKTGVGSTGTWPISITGSADTWGTIPASFSALGTTPVNLIGTEGGYGKAFPKVSVQDYLNINNGATINNNISGSATNWGGRSATLNAGVTSPVNILMVDNDGVVKIGDRTDGQNFLNVNNGTTLNNSVSGTAASASSWGGYTASFSTNAAAIDVVAVYDPTVSAFRSANLSLFRSWLGSPSGGETLQSITNRDNKTNNALFITGTELPTGTNAKGLVMSYSTTGDWANVSAYDYVNGLAKLLNINPYGGNVQIGYVSDQGYKFAVNGSVLINGAILKGVASSFGSSDLVIGNSASVLSSSAKIAINEDINLVSSGTHGFGDYSTITISGVSDASAYATFDSKSHIISNITSNHNVGFQSRNKYSGSGNINSYMYGFNSINEHNGSGVISEYAGLHINDILKTSTGTVTNSFGLKIENINSGVNSYSIFTNGGKHQFGGPVNNIGLVTNYNGTNFNTNQGKTSGSVRLVDFSSFETVGSRSSLFMNFIGSTLQKDREWLLQTVEEGVGYDGIISLQPAGGKIKIGVGGSIEVLAVNGNATFTGNVTAPNFIGNASSATSWGGRSADLTGAVSPAATHFLSTNEGFDPIVRRSTVSDVKTILGLGSNAFNSTTIPSNTNQLTNGAGFITSGALSAYLPLAGGALTGAVTSSASISANGFFDTSDIRLKEVIDQSFDTSSIKAISYKRRDMSDDNVWVGYSAQDVRDVMPYAVNEDEGGFLSLNYTQVLVNKVQALENEIAKMKGVLHGMG